jgi:uncharacterized OB-fold protein
VSGPYLKPGLPTPLPARDGLDAPYWEGLRRESLVIQRCKGCGAFQWGPEWICHRCLSFDLGWEGVDPVGRIYSYERVWHPVHSALAEQGPYVVVLVELPHANDVRLIGNLVGDPRQTVTIGAAVTGVFEHHAHAKAPFTLLQWRRKSG